MSYARFSPDSDVYVYFNGEGTYTCCGCKLRRDDWDHATPEKILAHLAEHEKAGHMVPTHCTKRLKKDLKEGRV